MKFIYKACLVFSFIVINCDVNGQEFYQHDTTVKVFAYGKQLPLAWCGGFNNPQFSQADLNHDGAQDLVIFEPGLGVMTLINRGMVAGLPHYAFEPKYALNFPAAYNYMLLRDYNCDGIADLFDRGGNGISVHKGYYNAANELCFAYYTDLFFDNDIHAGGFSNAYVNPGDIPGIADVDGDGDLDFVSYYITGGYMYYYRNMRVEDGLPCDSIRIKLKDKCWGKVYQGFYRTHQLGHSCDNSGLLRTGSKKTHSGNTPCLFDWDMDGDMDYLDGSVSFNEMTFLKNSRIESSYPVDTMTEQDTLWQTGGKKIEIPVWPAAFVVDVDLDDKKDLIISPNAGSGSENYNCIWYYKNNSTPGTPNWQFQSDSFLVNQAIDVGTASYPVLFDYDKDGKLDLMVGSDGYRQTSGVLKSQISLYKNTSTPGNASFELVTKDMSAIAAHNFQGAAPATGDIDNDGKTDLLVGHTNGTLSYFKNMAASDAVPPDWQLNQLELKDVNGVVINVDGNAAPFIYDIDKDGHNDIIIGSVYGFIQYYRNVSVTSGSVSFKLINNKLGKAKSDPLQNFGNFSTPFIGKIDPTGIDFLLMGSNSGNIYQYSGFQSGDTTAIYTLIDGQYAYIDSTHSQYNHPGTYSGIYGNRRTAITVGDIDGSGSYSLIKGNVRGGLEFYKRKVYVATTPSVSGVGAMNIYPNPAADLLNVSWAGDSNEMVYISIYNMTGQLCYRHEFPSLPGRAICSIANLAQGVYICHLETAGHRYYSKFSIIR